MRPALRTPTTRGHQTSHSGVRRCVAGGKKFDCLRGVALDSNPRDTSNACNDRFLFPETRSPALLEEREEGAFLFGIRDIRIHLLKFLSHFLNYGQGSPQLTNMNWVVVSRQILSDGNECMVLPLLHSYSRKRSTGTRILNFSLDAAWSTAKYILFQRLFA